MNDNMVISYLTMRKAIGWLGMLLPFILLTGNYCVNHLEILNSDWVILKDCYSKYTPNGSFKSSISHYYYTTVGELFTGTLCAVALFMFCYKGHPKRPGEKGLSDSLMTNLAGFFALGVVIFPTSADACISDNVRTFLSGERTGLIHFVSAALFFVTLALMSIVNFRRTDKIDDFGKKKNDFYYVLFGVIMIASIVLIFIYVKFIRPNTSALDWMRPVYSLEAIALIAFGSSWLKKGKVDPLYLPKALKIVNPRTKK